MNFTIDVTWTLDLIFLQVPVSSCTRTVLFENYLPGECGGASQYFVILVQEAERRNSLNLLRPFFA